MNNFHIMKKNEDGEWDYFFKKKDYPGRTRKDLGQQSQFHARENAKQISKRKGIGEIAIFYNGKKVDLFSNGKLIESEEIKAKEKSKKEGV